MLWVAKYMFLYCKTDQGMLLGLHVYAVLEWNSTFLK